jgi:hypothetical protein
VQSDKLPAANPLKLYVAIFEPYIKERLIKWVAQWNKEQGDKFGNIVIVADLAQSDVAAVFFWEGTTHPRYFHLGLCTTSTVPNLNSTRLLCTS